MKAIGGNKTAQLQIKNGTTKNAIGERVPNWETAIELSGFLDYQAGDSKYIVYNTKVQESTHIFICDYVALPEGVKAENSRMIIDGLRYDVMIIDDPMELHYQWEIYLKFTGEQ
jgi:hypothetical protein